MFSLLRLLLFFLLAWPVLANNKKPYRQRTYLSAASGASGANELARLTRFQDQYRERLRDGVQGKNKAMNA
jgi:hypothetical protein